MPRRYMHKTEFRHSEETKAKISRAHKGHLVSLETKAKISESIRGEKNPNFGKALTLEVKEKVSLSKKNFFLTHPEFDNAHSRGIPKTNKQRRDLSKIRRRYYKEHPEARETIRLVHIGRITPAETRAKQSESHKRLWRNPEYAGNKMRQYSAKPNKGELLLQGILQDLYPNQYKYNGDCNLGIVLDGCIPDFVNVNGKKQVIELFGEYWHKKPGRGEVERIKRFKVVGWDCLIIWWEELRDIDTLTAKIRTFVGGESNF